MKKTRQTDKALKKSKYMRLLGFAKRRRSSFSSLLLSIALLGQLCFISCDPSLDDSLDEPSLPSPATPQDYCVTLTKLEVEGGRRLYGLVCGVTSEDEFIGLDKAEATEKIRNCRPFFFQRDKTPLATERISRELLDQIIQTFAPELEDSLPPEDLLALYEFDTTPPEISGEKEYNVSKTFHLADKRNQRILLIVLPLFAAEKTACGTFLGFIPALTKPVDCVIYPQEGFTTAPQKFPGILEIRDKDFYENPYISQERVLTLREGGNEGDAVSFHFDIKREACASETAEEPLPFPALPPPDEDSDEDLVGPPPVIPNAHCVRLDSVAIDEDTLWDHKDGFFNDRPELYGRICAQSGDGDCQNLWEYAGDGEYMVGLNSVFLTRSVGSNAVVSLEDGDSIALRFYPIYDYDTFEPEDGMDDLLTPQGSQFSDKDAYLSEESPGPAKISISKETIGDSTTLSAAFKLESPDEELGSPDDVVEANGGTVTFNFSISKGACE